MGDYTDRTSWAPHPKVSTRRRDEQGPPRALAEVQQEQNAEKDYLCVNGMYGRLLSERGRTRSLNDPVINLLIAYPGGTRMWRGKGYCNVAIEAKAGIL